MGKTEEQKNIGQRIWDKIEELKSEILNNKEPNWFINCETAEQYLDAYLKYLRIKAITARKEAEYSQSPEEIENSKKTKELGEKTLELLELLLEMQKEEMITGNTQNNSSIKSRDKNIDINYQLIETIGKRLKNLEETRIYVYGNTIKSLIELAASCPLSQKKAYEFCIIDEIHKVLGGKELLGCREQLSVEQLKEIVERTIVYLKRPIIQRGLRETKTFLLALQAVGAFSQTQNQETTQPVEQFLQDVLVLTSVASNEVHGNPTSGINSEGDLITLPDGTNYDSNIALNETTPSAYPNPLRYHIN